MVVCNRAIVILIVSSVTSVLAARLYSFTRKRSQRYSPTITNLVLLLWMVMAHYSARYKATHVKFCTSLPWIFPRNMVRDASENCYGKSLSSSLSQIRTHRHRSIECAIKDIDFR